MCHVCMYMYMYIYIYKYSEHMKQTNIHTDTHIYMCMHIQHIHIISPYIPHTHHILRCIHPIQASVPSALSSAKAWNCPSYGP